jgi:uncharacterized membrane protein YraQ (UPF0718 family)
VDPRESQLTELFAIGSLTAFLVFGIGTEALAVIALFALFRRRGWLGKGR